MKILGIESTCDETAAAVVEKGEHILSNVIDSQAEVHAKFGGVFPEIASRHHVERMLPAIELALGKAGLVSSELDAIAVANKPGLMGSLLMGLTTAQCLSLVWELPLIGVNHTHAHLYASMMNQEKIFPAIGLVISGGHTFLAKLRSDTDYQIVSSTVDDALGEAFDKIAAMMDLPYPGGPHVEKLALKGNPETFSLKSGNVKENPLAFSFSGIKSSVARLIEKHQLSAKDYPDLAASFQKAVFSDLSLKIERLFQITGARSLYIGGGVSQNSALRTFLISKFPEKKIFFPQTNLSIDNAAMIAGMAYPLFQSENTDSKIKAAPKIIKN